MATRQQLRESIIEDWLAEANSDFFTDTVLNNGLDWAYRGVARAMGGVDARWDDDTTTTAPYEYALPRDLRKMERVTYNPAGPTGAGVKELTPLAYDDMFILYGREWIDDGAGTPDVVYFRGWRTFGFYPRASSVITDGYSIFGRCIPDNFSGDSAEALTPLAFDDTIAAGGYAYAIRRLIMQNGGRAPQNFGESLQAYQAGLEDARRFHASLRSGVRVAGSVPRGTRNDWATQRARSQWPFTWP